ncbi:MAG: GNAT family N-acetyltransferase [Candidatus Polarisedimenticolia bacterium]
MHLDLGRFIIRDWRAGDAEALIHHANNRRVSINLRDTFPWPYTGRDAAEWIRTATTATPVTHFAIEIDGEAAGGIGLRFGRDVFRQAAEIGFWLGEPYWNRGIVTEAVRALTDYAFEHFPIVRIQAGVFDWNPASRRVFAKAGYAYEGCMRQTITKDGKVIDLHVYARLRDQGPVGGSARAGARPRRGSARPGAKRLPVRRKPARRGS